MKYVILKLDDIENYCSDESKKALTKLNLEITTGRMQDHKSLENRYLVVNMDEPYAEKVKDLIEKHENERVTFD